MNITHYRKLCVAYDGKVYSTIHEFKSPQGNRIGIYIGDNGLPYHQAERLLAYWNMHGKRPGLPTYYYTLIRPNDLTLAIRQDDRFAQSMPT